MPSTNLWKLRRLAPRVERVVARRSAEASAVAVFGKTIVPKAKAFAAAYDKALAYQATWRSDMAAGRGAAGAVLATLRGWLPLAVRDIPGFITSDYGDRPGVPDDVIADVQRFLDVLESARGRDGEPLPWTADAAKELEPRLEAAAKEWAEAEAADRSYQELLAASRAAAALFDAELQLFRRTILGTFGFSDKDYQRLRASRAAAREPDDPPGLPEPVSSLPTAADTAKGPVPAENPE